MKNDLDPYLCLFEDCNQPDELYSHSDEWFAHLNQHAQRWRCSSHHDLDPFSTREEYIEHLRNVHNSKLSDAQLRVLANKSIRKAAKLFQSCPLCGKDEIEVDRRLEDHIVGHLRSLAIKSLPSYEEDIPDNDGIGMESIDVSRAQSRSTVKNLEDVTFLGFGTNFTLDELMNNSGQDENYNLNFLGVPHSDLDPGYDAWPTSWAYSSGDLTIHNSFMSGEEDPILQSILERQKDKVTVLDDQAREDLEPPLDHDGSDTSKTTRNDPPGQGEGPSTSDTDATDPLPSVAQSKPHWVELVFADPPNSHTEIHEPQRSKAWGPFIPANDGSGSASSAGPRLPDAARVLLRRSFDGDRLRLMIIINAANGGPYLVLRKDTGGAPLFSYRGIHEICTRRVDNALRLKRWSHSNQGPKFWAILSFVTWEGKEVALCTGNVLGLYTLKLRWERPSTDLVLYCVELTLFHCTLITLKVRNNLTVAMDPREFKFQDERRLFQA